jgi:hypothetical protein
MRTIFIDGSTLIDVVARVHLQLSDEEFEWEYNDGIPVCNWNLEAAERSVDNNIPYNCMYYMNCSMFPPT